MRTAFLALLALGTVTAIDAMEAAQARDYPFCIKGREYDQVNGDCSFTTYQQCLATASGRYAYCDANPFYNDGADASPRPRRKHARRSVD